MTQSSRFWTTSGVGDGPSAGYGIQPWYDFLRKILAGQEDSGVLSLISNELLVTGNESPLSVDTGAAIVYGMFYENTAAATLVVNTPLLTTGGRVVLEADYTAQTIRAKVIMSEVGETDPPAVTQTPGTLYQLSLAFFVITNTGAISIYDDRTYVHFSTRVSSDMIEDFAVSTNKILPESLIGAHVMNGIPVALDAIGKVGYGPFVWPASASTESWDLSSTKLKMQFGLYRGSGETGTAWITFPTEFSGVPFITCEGFAGCSAYVAQYNGGTQFQMGWSGGTPFGGNTDLRWMAIGPA